MFNYTNTVVINSLIDEFSGEPIYSINTDKHYMDVRKVVRLIKDTLTDINGEHIFDQAFYREGIEGKVDNCTIDMAAINAGYYRIKAYIQLSGVEESEYANDFVFKGKPLYFEFEVVAGKEADAAKDAAKIANKYQSMYNNKYLKFSNNSTTLIVEGVNEFQRIIDLELEVFDDASKKFIPSGKSVVKTAGYEAFGDYYHILKDLRLPTVENTSWTSVNAKEMPVPGALYDQYTVHLRKNRGHVAGGGCVGQEVVSITTHVFYVRKGLELTEAQVNEFKGDAATFPATFKAALEAVGFTVTPITNKVGRSRIAPMVANSESTLLEVSESSIVLNAEGEAQTITVNSDKAVVAAPSKDWIKTTVLGSTVTVEAERNTTGKEYSGSITITSGGKTAQVLVKQLAS